MSCSTETARQNKFVIIYTVFPRNLAAATFNFVVQFGAATFRGRRLKYSLHYYTTIVLAGLWASVRIVRYLESTSI